MNESKGNGDAILFQSRVAIVIVNWNGKEDTFACLETVRKIDYPDCEVIVVDNASTDDSVRAIRQRFPEVVVLEAEKNFGTAGGRNIGIKYALSHEADYILFLDNDAVADAQLVHEFLKAAAVSKDYGILGAKIYYYDNPHKIWYAGSKWEHSGFTHVGMGEVDDGKRFQEIVETAYACGCALLLNREVLEAIGLFDENYYCYFEETDFCYRAKAAGFKTFFVPSALVWHKISGASGGERSPLFYYFMNRNVLLWAERHLPLREKLSLYRHMLRTVWRAVRPSAIRSVDAEERHDRSGFFGLFRKYRDKCANRCQDAAKRATLMGVRDYLFRRFGDCPDAVRMLCRRTLPS